MGGLERECNGKQKKRHKIAKKKEWEWVLRFVCHENMFICSYDEIYMQCTCP